MENQTGEKKESRTIAGILAYLGPLLVVSYLIAGKDPFVKFHIKQGLVLLIIDAILWFLGPMFWTFYMLMRLIHLALLILIILGIINVVKGKERELPFIGSLARYFKF